MKTTKPENFQRLLDELRSGDREQGDSALRQVYKIPYQPGIEVVKDCCLGVACDISGLGHWEPDSAIGSKKRLYVIPDFGFEGDLLPRPVLDWLGVDPEDAYPSPTQNDRWNLNVAPTEVPNTWHDTEDGLRYAETAAEANDGGLTFSEIADLLEQEYMS